MKYNKQKSFLCSLGEMSLVYNLHIEKKCGVRLIFFKSNAVSFRSFVDNSDVPFTKESRSIYILWVKQFCIFRHKNVLKICLTTQKSSQVTDILLCYGGVVNWMFLHGLVLRHHRKGQSIVYFSDMISGFIITPSKRLIGQKKAQKVYRKWHCLYFLMFFFTQQYSWAQDQIEFFLGVTRDINAIALNAFFWC